MKKKVNAAILIIGNEILSGRTQDKNIAFLSNWLNTKCGITVREVRIIPDVQKTIVDNILLLSKKFNYVFTTGGIGPTHDDITAQSISKAFKVKYEYHPEAYEILERYYGKKKFNDGRKKKLAEFPDSVTSRGLKHINELVNAGKKKYKIYILFLVQRDDCDSFSIAKDIDPNYSIALRKAVKNNLNILCYDCKFSTKGIKLNKKMKIKI